MKCLVVTIVLLPIVLCDHVVVKMPYSSPAAVTYLNSIETQQVHLGHTPIVSVHPATVPFQYASALQYVAPAVPTKVETRHIGYATAQVPAVATVPFVKHVPTISQIPITRIEAHPAVLEKQIDVAKPAVSTRKVEVRRPAIQKQFYDIEERVIIRPAGSAVVELDEPISKMQKGSAVIQPLTYHQIDGAYTYPGAIAEISNVPTAIPALASAVHTTPSSPVLQSSTIAPSNPNNSESDSIIVENANLRDAINQEDLARLGISEPPAIANLKDGAPLSMPTVQFAAHDPSPSVIPSQRITSEQSRVNQNRFIELLTARGGVTEIGFGREATTGISAENHGHVRARVLSVTSPSEHVDPAGERVSTRRIVVSRPIETFQEYNVVEPATKIDRLSVQQPTLIKTARVDHVQVHDSTPVIGKILSPAVAHASIPVFQKTVSPVY